MSGDHLFGLAGGLMIGGAAALLFWLQGRIAGVSGILVRAFGERGAEAHWRWAWLAGLALGGAAVLLAFPAAAFAPRTGYPVALLVAAGFIVGFGTRLGSGCTSGHGVCGVARLSKRSLVATGVFMAAGVATTFVVRHVAGVA